MMFKSSFVFGTWILFAAMVAHADSKDVNAQFISAASSGSLSRVQSLLAQGAQLNAQDIIGDSALHWAALECHLDVVKFLTAQPGIQMNPRDSAGDLRWGWLAARAAFPLFSPSLKTRKNEWISMRRITPARRHFGSRQHTDILMSCNT